MLGISLLLGGLLRLGLSGALHLVLLGLLGGLLLLGLHGGRFPFYLLGVFLQPGLYGGLFSLLGLHCGLLPHGLLGVFLLPGVLGGFVHLGLSGTVCVLQLGRLGGLFLLVERRGCLPLELPGVIL